MPTHWLQACGIFSKIMDPFMNDPTDPLKPLPKKSLNESLKVIQLIGLWLMWAIGVAAGLLAFFVEAMAGVKAKWHSHRAVRQNFQERQEQTQVMHPMANIPHGHEERNPRTREIRCHR